MSSLALQFRAPGRSRLATLRQRFRDFSFQMRPADRGLEVTATRGHEGTPWMLKRQDLGPKHGSARLFRFVRALQPCSLGPRGVNDPFFGRSLLCGGPVC